MDLCFVGGNSLKKLKGLFEVFLVMSWVVLFPLAPRNFRYFKLASLLKYKLVVLCVSLNDFTGGNSHCWVLE